MLIEDERIAAVATSIETGGAAVIDARGKIVMPGSLPHLRQEA